MLTKFLLKLASHNAMYVDLVVTSIPGFSSQAKICQIMKLHRCFPVLSNHLSEAANVLFYLCLYNKGLAVDILRCSVILIYYIGDYGDYDI